VIVADTNLVAYAFVDGEFSAQARAVFAKDPEWHAPLLWRAEMLSVLVQACKSEMLTSAQAASVLEMAMSHMANREHISDEAVVLQTAVARNISAYDAQFIALALELQVPLVTSDKRLLASCRDVAVSPASFVER
jgi:predicted nucleic acid-binding protein